MLAISRELVPPARPGPRVDIRVLERGVMDFGTRSEGVGNCVEFRLSRGTEGYFLPSEMLFDLEDVVGSIAIQIGGDRVVEKLKVEVEGNAYPSGKLLDGERCTVRS